MSNPHIDPPRMDTEDMLQGKGCDTAYCDRPAERRIEYEDRHIVYLCWECYVPFVPNKVRGKYRITAIAQS